jgi:aldehyde dehydrogenase (NAD+)
MTHLTKLDEVAVRTLDPARVDRAYIGGRWCKIRNGDTVLLYDPSTGAIRGTLVCAGGDLVDEAVAAARAAQLRWRDVPVAERAAMLVQLADEIGRRSEQFAHTIAREMGAPIDYARIAHVARAELCILETRKSLLALAEETLLDPRFRTDRVLYDPLGPAGLITPWNWPLNQLVSKTASALAAGCSCVLKPSEVTPETAILFAECVAATDLPAGVFNLILGARDTGAYLVAHPSIATVSFTGASRSGRAVAESAARHLKTTVLELGGKCANVVFADRACDSTCDQAIEAAFRNAGQSCNSAARLVVERKVYNTMIDRLVARAEAIKLGSAYAPGQHMGPVATQAQQRAILAHIEKAQAEGARLVAGGAHVARQGYFIRPTIFADVTPDHTLFSAEVFGPVLSLTPFDSEDEAVALANHGAYGLAAFVQSEDLVRADRVARQLEVGTVQINGASRQPAAPFGGRKASGLGRELGPWGIRAFQTPKSISGSPVVRLSKNFCDLVL